MRACARFAAAALVVAIVLTQAAAAGAATLSQGCEALNSANLNLDATYNNHSFSPLSFAAGDTITFTASDGSGVPPPAVSMIALSVTGVTPPVFVSTPFLPPASATLTYMFPAAAPSVTVTWLVGYDPPGLGFTQWLAYDPAWEVSCAAQNHFKCYSVKGPNLKSQTVTLEDQFGDVTTSVKEPKLLCNPVDKNGEGIPNPSAHLVCYAIKDRIRPPNVLVNNQFGAAELEVKESQFLCVPSTKSECPANDTINISTGQTDASGDSLWQLTSVPPLTLGTPPPPPPAPPP